MDRFDKRYKEVRGMKQETLQRVRSLVAGAVARAKHNQNGKGATGDGHRQDLDSGEGTCEQRVAVC